jgi:hypothetical protein
MVADGASDILPFATNQIMPLPEFVATHRARQPDPMQDSSPAA